jgi:hypothetical protein
MDFGKHLACLITGTLMLLNYSCLSIHYQEGKTILGATTDTILNGSSIITGHVYHIDFLPDYPYASFPDEIWMENAQYRTTVDSLGNYTLRVSPGTYTVKCQEKGNQWVQLVEEKRDLILSANKKVQLDFYIGYRVE